MCADVAGRPPILISQCSDSKSATDYNLFCRTGVRVADQMRDVLDRYPCARQQRGGAPTDGRPRFATSADLARVAGRSLLLLALPWQYFAACVRSSSNSSPRTRSSRSRPWSWLSSDGTYRRPVGSSMMPRIRPIRRTYVQARSAAAAGEGAGVTARFGAAVRGGSAVTTRATPKIASPPPMSTTPVTGSDKITAPNNTATAGLT